jgi:ATP-dependent Clp protease ATP-binding subunit ClpA
MKTEASAMFNRFTDRARKVMHLAKLEAQRFDHEYVGTEHILLGLVKEGAGVAAIVLRNLDADLRKLRIEVEKIVQSSPDDSRIAPGKLPLTPRAKKAIEYAVDEARYLNHNYIGSEHLLLGLLREEEGIAAVILQNLGLRCDCIREQIHQVLAADRSAGASSSLLIPQEETADLPGEVQHELADLNAQLEALNGQKESAVATQDFEKAAHLRDQADKLNKRKRTLLRQWHLHYFIQPSWLRLNDGAVAKLAEAITLEKRWSDLAALGDALEKAGCANAEILHHCREGWPHRTSCWVVNLLRAAVTDSPPPP